MAVLYHERQQLYRCGIHALNNALQGAPRLSTSLYSGSACVGLNALSPPQIAHSPRSSWTRRVSAWRRLAAAAAAAR
jgi:hypothetical protein